MARRDDDYQRFQGLGYEDFRRLALDDTLSPHERIGFPDAYREGKDEAILTDIVGKLPALTERGRTVVDIGPGCGPLALRLIALCRDRGHRLVLIDSEEMLRRLPDAADVIKIPGLYPRDAARLFDEYRERVDAVLTYSVLQYVFAEGNIFDFLDRTLTLLAPGGRLLAGDIPNVSKRKRFFASDTGVQHHQAFTGRMERPPVVFNTMEAGQIDDAVIAALWLRCRNAGFDAYVMPQAPGLPMANRREDLLVCRP
jgi:hypothetical protein